MDRNKCASDIVDDVLPLPPYHIVMASMERSIHVLSRPVGAAFAGAMILSLGIVFSLAAPVAAQGPPGEINVSSEAGITPPGESLEVNTTVTNDGDRTLTGIEVWVTDPPADWTTSNSTIERLEPNQSTTVSLNITVPEDADTGLYNLTVRAESPENVSDEDTMEITVRDQSATPETPTETGAGSGSGATETPTPTPTCDGQVIFGSCVSWLPDISLSDLVPDFLADLL